MLGYWDPFSEMARIQDRFFNRAVDGDYQFKPAVDIHEDEEGIHLEADLAGLKPEDIKVAVENHVLTISGERKLDKRDERENYHRVERFRGSFTRSFALSDEVDPEHIDAKYDAGVLTVSLRKRPAARRKEIAIKAA